MAADEHEATSAVTEEAPIEGSPVRPVMGGHRVLEMDALGWLIFLGLLIILIPLLPALLVLVIFLRLFGWSDRRLFSWPTPSEG